MSSSESGSRAVVDEGGGGTCGVGGEAEEEAVDAFRRDKRAAAVRVAGVRGERRADREGRTGKRRLRGGRWARDDEAHVECEMRRTGVLKALMLSCTLL